MELAVVNNEYRELVTERIQALVNIIKSQEDRHRRSGVRSTAIVSGIAIARSENSTIARAFLKLHEVPEETINRVLSGQHRKTDV